MIWFHKKRGFTLLELMIVVIIIGILATLALPRFIKAADRARWAAAAQTLGIIRGAQMRYYAQYTAWATSMASTVLDIDLPDSSDWNVCNPAGTDAEVGQVLYKKATTNNNYTIAANGTITGYNP